MSSPSSEPVAEAPAQPLCHNCERERGYVGTHEVLALGPGGKKQRWRLCDDCFENSVILQRPDLYDGALFAWYTPMLFQRPYHASETPYLLALGTRGTGKSTMCRRDAIIRCMKYPGFKALILRRKMPDLRNSHLKFIGREMRTLGEKEVGYYRQTSTDVVFHNGSFIQFSHCESINDVQNYLGSEWDLIVFDEISTFPLEMFLTICAASRSVEDADYRALVRCGSNPMGIGSQWMKSWFIDHDVDLAEYPDYDPADFEFQFSSLDQNRYVQRADYEKKLRNLPEHLRRAWLKGEFVVEGAYFSDFKKIKEVEVGGVKQDIPWHCIQKLPKILDKRSGRWLLPYQVPWINVYRSIDWGWDPDPAVCHWHFILPNRLKITFGEITRRKTLAKDFADEIKELSAGMRIVETYCDPSIFFKKGEDTYSIGEQIENKGVPLTQAQNSRELFGYSVHELLNTMITDEDGTEQPSWQILEWACPQLVKTIPVLQMDPTDPRKLADGPDHWVVSVAYFAMGQTAPSRIPQSVDDPPWMAANPFNRIVIR